MIGQTILHYRVDALLGEGGMGSVYRGTNLRLDQTVAIKMLHSHLARDPGVRERFEDEARLQARLNHPNIVRVYDFYAENDRLCMIMEYVDGRSLEEVVMGRTGPLRQDEMVEILRQTLQALGFAHSQGVIHRDIKPSNIVVQSFEGQIVARVMDFGIAKIIGGRDRTSTGTKMGTLWYMSPEQVKNAKDVDQRADLYALGVTLYQMATGKVPFEADSDYEIMEKIIKETPPPPSAVFAGVPLALEQVIMKAMAKDRRDRFQNAAEFAAALSALNTTWTPTPRGLDAGGHSAAYTTPAPITPSLAARTTPAPRAYTPPPPPPVATPSGGNFLRNLAIVSAVAAVLLTSAVMIGEFSGLFNHPAVSRPSPAASRPQERPAIKPPQERPTPSPQVIAGVQIPSYVISVGEYQSEQAAIKQSANIRNRGFPSDYLWIPDFPSLSGKPLFMVYVGPFLSREEARRVLARTKRTDRDAYGVKLDSRPGVETFQ